MQEQIIQFGPERRLIGITTAPGSSAPTSGKPAVLLLNAGLVHRIGPYRMHVALARRLAASGYPVLRFDLSGIGDSAGYATSLDYRQRTVEEIRAAMDALQQRHAVSGYIAVGLCSGAMNAHIIATEDERIRGAVLLDAYGYPTLRFLCRRYAGTYLKFLDPRALAGLIAKRLQRKRGQEPGEEGIDYWEFPSRAQAQADLEKLVARDLRLLYIYTGGIKSYYNYGDQFRDNFKAVDFRDCLDLDYMEEVDHTFTLLRDRERLFTRIDDWLRTHFPGDRG